MEKNLSIIQGLTSADQANPVRITNSGELKVEARITNAPVNNLSVEANPAGDPILNEVFGYNYTIDTVQPFSIIENGDNVVAPKLLVEQGKQFAVYETYVVDTNSLGETDIQSWINSNIGNWIGAHGPRYDELIISSVGRVTPTPTNMLIMTIVRYY